MELKRANVCQKRDDKRMDVDEDDKLYGYNGTASCAHMRGRRVSVAQGSAFARKRELGE